MTEQNQRERMKYMYGRFVSKSTDAETGEALSRYYFTSANMDEMGDTITQAATEEATERWRDWRNIRLQHISERPIGKAVRIGKADGLDWNLMDVRIDDPTVLPLVQGYDPVLGGASVGIFVKDYELDKDEEAIRRAAPWDPWVITEYDFVEISLVDHPANYDAKRVGQVETGRGALLFRRRDLDPRVKSVSGNTGLPIGDRERAWDASAAAGRVRSWAGGPAKEDIDWGKYRQAFFWYDEGDSENFGSYKLPFADVISGTLTAIPRGVFAAAQRLGATDISEDDREGVRGKISRYYARMRDEFDDDSIVPPWENQEERNMEEETIHVNEPNELALASELEKDSDSVEASAGAEEAPVVEELGVEEPEESVVDPALVALDEIKGMITALGESVTTKMDAIHEFMKPVVEAAPESELEEALPQGGPVEDVEPAETEAEDPLAVLSRRLEEIYAKVFGTEAEDGEVETSDFDRRVEQKVEEILQEKQKLQPRKSVVVEENEVDKQEPTLNPRDRLRASVNRAFSTNEE